MVPHKRFDKIWDSFMDFSPLPNQYMIVSHVILLPAIQILVRSSAGAIQVFLYIFYAINKVKETSINVIPLGAYLCLVDLNKMLLFSWKIMLQVNYTLQKRKQHRDRVVVGLHKL